MWMKRGKIICRNWIQKTQEHIKQINLRDITGKIVQPATIKRHDVSGEEEEGKRTEGTAKPTAHHNTCIYTKEDVLL